MPVGDDTVGAGRAVVSAAVPVESGAALERVAAMLDVCKASTWFNKFANDKKARVLFVILCGSMSVRTKNLRF